MNMAISAGIDGPPDGFAILPAVVYGDDPHWIPEEPAAVLGAFSSANPWFETGLAHLVCEPGQARIACFIAPNDVTGGSQAAYFGYWATTSNAEVDAAIFADIESWAMQQGASTMYGPVDFTTYGNYRLLTTPGVLPFPGEPYNHVHYAAILDGLGYTSAERYNSRFLSERLWRPYLEAAAPVLEQHKARGYHFELLTVETWLSRLPELHELADSVFEDNFAYRPLPYEMFAAYCGESFVRKACPHTSVLAYGPKGDLAGISLCLPHYGPLVVAAAGNERVTPADLDFRRHTPLLIAKGPVDMIIKTTAVRKSHRGQGLLHSLVAYNLIAGQNLGYLGRWIGATARVDNLSQHAFGGQADEIHEYVLYTKELR